MLSALELAGFKSFADRTRFEFPEGITVIVGPNGSGKSNVVDAIKWVLGAQSAKALRGKEMTDVIFKGSSSANRKPCNSAEATLVFDNSAKKLAVDSEEVSVTRRVYRSGESEYLINGTACRLKDIRDLFRGTGVGVDAYSLIEQGKVDRMLQASPKDRRVIFEEAAGISRFNAKKLEANRRLGRVDQNLVRLKDIVDEVHTRLSTLQNQASKAQRYREMTSRLQHLRLRLGWTEYRELEEKLETIQAKLETLRDNHASHDAELEEAKQEAQTAELNLHRVAEECQQVEGLLQDALQSIAVSQNQQTSLRTRRLDIAEQQQRQAVRLATLRARAGTLEKEVTSVASQAQDAQDAFDTAKENVERCSQQTHAMRQELKEYNDYFATQRTEHLELLKSSSETAATAAQKKDQLKDLVQSVRLLEEKIGANQNAERAARNTAEHAATRLKQIHDESSSAAEVLAKTREDLDKHRILLSSQQEQNALLKGRLAGATERFELLSQLQQHFEGVDAGARHVLGLAKQESNPAYQTIHGLVAGLLDVQVDLAPLIDTALGTKANALVLKDGQLVQLVRSGQLDVPGRLSLMRLDRLPTRRFGEKIQLDGVSGVLGRADRLVQCPADVQPLIRYLLGTTWLVESLDVALELGHFRGAGLRFVTAACQLIESDGTITIGALQTSSGLVSRRSEIKNAEEEISLLRKQFQKTLGETERTTGRIAKLAPVVDELEIESKKLVQETANWQSSAQNAVGKLDQIEIEGISLATSLAQEIAERDSIQPSIIEAESIADGIRSQLERLETSISEQEDKIRDLNSQLETESNQETSAKVTLARSEQNLESVTAALQQSSRSQQERLQAVEDADVESHRMDVKQNHAELELLELSTVLSESFLHSEDAEAKLEQLAARAAKLRQVRTETARRHENAKRTIDRIRGQCETSQLELERYQESSQLLLKRYREDYEIEYEQLSSAERIGQKTEVASMDKEASVLRQDIASVGEVNMAALAELDELQQRYDLLNGQYEDLQAAKESLQRIIQKINNDSRRLFLDTLEVIRQNFQKLYRKSFGGGNADIVLEDADDVLECGIDIVATPPGKTELSNSLLSGGEKALTAVALLLAIFQYRPSPFCVLDEVDAPFDEANIGRFVNVLSEFLDWTKFIIVTHSKKTMTASTTLYGITMQESGVSKQVAVRFEDVNEKGEVIKHEPPVRRAA